MKRPTTEKNRQKPLQAKKLSINEKLDKPSLVDSAEILEKIPLEVREVMEQRGLKITAEMYRGPFMPPSILAEYEREFPGWGTRLLELTERQVTHRHEQEKNQLTRTENRMDRGQLFGNLIAGLSLVATAATAIIVPSSWPLTVLELGVVIVGVGGPAVARILATKFRWPIGKSEK